MYEQATLAVTCSLLRSLGMLMQLKQGSMIMIAACNLLSSSEEQCAQARGRVGTYVAATPAVRV